MDRVESLIGRYPIGFRHYENYENYKRYFPNSTIQDYQDDGKNLTSFKINFIIFVSI